MNILDFEGEDVLMLEGYEEENSLTSIGSIYYEISYKVIDGKIYKEVKKILEFSGTFETLESYEYTEFNVSSIFPISDEDIEEKLIYRNSKPIDPDQDIT